MANIKSNLKLIVGIILMLFIIFLGAIIISDLLVVIFKASLSKTIFKIIHFILIYIFIRFLFKTRPMKHLEKEIILKFKKKK